MAGALVSAAGWPCLPGTWLGGCVGLHRSAVTHERARYNGRMRAKLVGARDTGMVIHYALEILKGVRRELGSEAPGAVLADLELSLRPFAWLRLWVGRR